MYIYIFIFTVNITFKSLQMYWFNSFQFDSSSLNVTVKKKNESIMSGHRMLDDDWNVLIILKNQQETIETGVC